MVQLYHSSHIVDTVGPTNMSMTHAQGRTMDCPCPFSRYLEAEMSSGVLQGAGRSTHDKTPWVAIGYARRAMDCVIVRLG